VIEVNLELCINIDSSFQVNDDSMELQALGSYIVVSIAIWLLSGYTLEEKRVFASSLGPSFIFVVKSNFYLFLFIESAGANL